MQSALFIYIIVGQTSAILQLLTGKDEPLLFWWDPFFVLNLRFDSFNGIARFDVQCDRFSSEGFDKNLHVCSTIKPLGFIVCSCTGASI